MYLYLCVYVCARAHHPTEMIAHTTAFVMPVVEHWQETRKSLMGPPCGIDPTTRRTRADTLPRSYISICEPMEDWNSAMPL